MSERVLDARLHGRGGGVEECDREAAGREYPVVTRMLLDRHELVRKIREWEPEATNADSIDPESMIQNYAEAYHRAALASNPSPEPEPDPKRAFDLYGICIAYEQGFGYAHRDLVNPYMKDADMHAAYDIGKQRGLDDPSPEPVEDADEFDRWWGSRPACTQGEETLARTAWNAALLRSQAGQGRVTADPATHPCAQQEFWEDKAARENWGMLEACEHLAAISAARTGWEDNFNQVQAELDALLAAQEG